MLDNEKETQTIYIRIPFNGLEYIYSMPVYKIGKGVYEEFDFNAIYSTKEKICLFKNFWGKQANTIQEEEIGFYERSRVVKNFNKIFAKILPSIFIAKYKNKALNKIKIKEQETSWRKTYYIDKARAIYCRKHRRSTKRKILPCINWFYQKRSSWKCGNRFYKKHSPHMGRRNPHQVIWQFFYGFMWRTYNCWSC